MTPQPWPRTGPGVATDGKPRFDLDTFDEAYFERLRERVIAAGERGMYVAVMLFDGWALHLSPAPDHIEGHPFHAENNVNGIGIGSILDYQVLPLDPRVQALQEAYIRKVVDTLHDLPNVLWEVANESSGGGRAGPEFTQALGLAETPDWGDSTAWQYWVIDTVKRHEQQMGYEPHPIGMTMQFPVAEQTKVNDPLLASRAEWISPGYDDEIFADGRAPDGAGLAAIPLARGPARGGRTEGRHHRHRPLRTGQGRRTVGLEVVPARPPPDPHGLRADRLDASSRRADRGHVRARAVRDGRHAALRRREWT